MALGKFQTALQALYPPRCLGCGMLVNSDFGLCGACWRDTPFIGGIVCDSCGISLPGTENEDEILQCDDCMTTERPWKKGRAAMLYKDNGRRMVLSLKHGDRQEIARPAALWLAAAARDILFDNMLIAPVPLHWTRMVKRRYNQSALLAQALARHTGLPWCPDLLQRKAKTQSLEGKSRDQRFDILRDAITAHPKRRHKMAGRRVLLIDDVMTSGATFTAATQACLTSRASEVYILSLARVAKDA